MPLKKLVTCVTPSQTNLNSMVGAFKCTRYNEMKNAWRKI